MNRFDPSGPSFWGVRWFCCWNMLRYALGNAAAYCWMPEYAACERASADDWLLKFNAKFAATPKIEISDRRSFTYKMNMTLRQVHTRNFRPIRNESRVEPSLDASIGEYIFRAASSPATALCELGIQIGFIDAIHSHCQPGTSLLLGGHQRASRNVNERTLYRVCATWYRVPWFQMANSVGTKCKLLNCVYRLELGTLSIIAMCSNLHSN